MASSKVTSRDAALRLLGVRPRSAEELRRRLVQKKYSAGEIEESLAWLASHGWVNDEAFATAWQDGRAGRGMGKGRVKQELLGKGVSRSVVERTLAGWDEEGERERAWAWAQKRFRTLSRLPADVARRRLYGMLGRRGFSPDLIRWVIKRIDRAEHDDADNVDD